MNKESKTDYSSKDALDNLDNYDLSTSVRGKYDDQYQALKGNIPRRIHTNDGTKQVILHTVKAKGILDEQGNFKTNIISELLSGEYEITMIIEENQNSNE
ncbi:hypothetical protein [Chroococcus sp. FPU101]|uniref:hypothetical protein n=1 Tax=Chroococcus sp. FPU101 TaxID=1974212 RepID=UPI001A906A87|nr:hypothetical protein [Chroococcus sp. FPU101]GFE70392.1 hypothetical protein CFPU101_30020 [Chroococcus sp. FPU101]